MLQNNITIQQKGETSMIITNGTNQQIEGLKARAGISGDVYLINDHLMESLESHKRLFPDSTATTIQEAEAERVAYELAFAEELARQQEEARLQAEQEAENNEDGEEPTEEE